jgi:hypothetical protein
MKCVFDWKLIKLFYLFYFVDYKPGTQITSKLILLKEIKKMGFSEA